MSGLSLVAALVALGAGFLASEAEAAFCRDEPFPGFNARTFEVTTAGATCYAAGNNAGANLPITAADFIALAGGGTIDHAVLKSPDSVLNLVLLDSLETDGAGTYLSMTGYGDPDGFGIHGAFEFELPTGYRNPVLLLQHHGGRLAVDWAAFLLPQSAAGFSGAFDSIWRAHNQPGCSNVGDPPAQVAACEVLPLIRADLYATAVPLPAGVWLMLGGLGGLGLMARRRGA